MENKPLEKKAIVLSAQEFKDGQYPRTVIKDQEGKKYTVWHKKKDGNPTKAFEQLGALNLGQKVGISYDEEEKTFTPTDGDNKGKEVKFMSRRIAFFADLPEETPIKEEFQFKSELKDNVSNALGGSVDTSIDQSLPVDPNEIVVEDLPF